MIGKIILFLVLISSFAYASDYLVDDDMDMLGNSIHNATYVNSTYIFQGGYTVLSGGTMTDGKVCIYDSASNIINCTATVSGTGDILGVNTDGDYLDGGCISGTCSLTVNMTSMNSTIESIDTATNTTMKAYVDSQDTTYNTSLKAYVDSQDTAFNDSLKAYSDGTFITQANEGNLDVNKSDNWDNHNTPIDITEMGNVTFYKINATCCGYFGTIQATDGNSIAVQPTGDLDDYFSFKTPSHRPTIKREGGKFVYFESTNAYDVGISFRADATYSGTLNYEKDDHKMTLLGKNSPVAIKTNSEYANYFLFETISHLPQLSAYNATYLTIADNLTITGNLKVDTLTNGSVLFITDNGAISQSNSNLYYDSSNGGSFAIGDNSDMRNIIQAVKSEGITDIDNVKALIAVRNTETTNNNWVGYTWQTDDTAGDTVSVLRVMAHILNHTTGAVSSEVLFEIRDNGAKKFIMNMTKDGVDVLGHIKSQDWTNVSITESQVSDADWWDADGDIGADEISESKINFVTSCGSGNRLYISGNDLACEVASGGTYYNTSPISLVGTTFGLETCSDNQILKMDGVNWNCEVDDAGAGSYTFNLTADTGTVQIVDTGNVVDIAGGTNGIDTVVGTTDTVTINMDWTEVASNTIAEAKIDMDTVCGAGNHLYVNGNNLACESDDDTTYTHLSNFTDDIGVSADWDELADVPLATPTNGDVTHLSTANQIYDFVIARNYKTLAEIVDSIDNWSSDKVDYYTSTETDTEITNANTSMKDYVDSQDTTFNDTLKAYTDSQDTTYNNTLKAYLDSQDTTYNDTLGAYVDSQDTIYNDSLKAYTDTELAAQDACSEITGCVVGAVTTSDDTVSSSELDGVCSTDDKILKRTAGTWVCADESGTSYYNHTGLGLNSSNYFEILLGYRAPQGCNDGEIQEYNTTSGGWDCAIDNTAEAGMSNWVLASSDTGGSESITEGETVTLADGDTGYLTATRSTNTVTYTFNDILMNETIDARDSDTTYTFAKDLVGTSPITINGGTNVDNIIYGADADVTIAITTLKDLVAGDGLNGGANDVLIGTDSDVTFTFDCSEAIGAGMDCDGENLIHNDSSSQASSDNSGRTYIQDIILDTYGHITSIVTATETVTDTTYTAEEDLIYLDGTVFKSNGTVVNNSIEAYGYSTDTNTNANTICSGSTTYLDGEGNCDDISSVYAPVNYGDDWNKTYADTLYTANTGTVTSVATDDTYLTGGAITTTGTITFNTTLAGTSLAVDSSDKWDALDSPSDINAADITDDGTYRLQSWNNLTGIPHATPTNGDTTHFSLADEIYDFVIGLGYTTLTAVETALGNWSADKSSYYTSAETDTEITDTNTSMKAYVDTQDISYNDTLKAYLDTQDTTYNDSMKSYVDGTFSQLGSSIDDTEMTAEDFGEFTCTGNEDGCTLDTGTFDDEYVELADDFVGDVTGPYSATVVGDDSHNHTYATITGMTEANLYTILTDVSEFLETNDAGALATLNTGQGANELYDMDQNVLTSSDVKFDDINMTGNLTIQQDFRVCYNADCSNYETFNGTCHITKIGTTTLEICE